MSPYMSYRVLILLFLVVFIINLFNYMLTTPARPSKYRKAMVYSQRRVLPEMFRPQQESTEVSREAAKSRGRPSTPETTSVDDISSTIVTLNDDLYVSETTSNFASNAVDPCPELPPDLGAMPPFEEVVSMATKDNVFSELKRGGLFQPDDCKARHSVAVVVPFRDSKKHLSPFLYYMHSFLMKQQLKYQIFIVENFNKSASSFNHAQLFNIGFKEAQTQHSGGWGCVVLHEPYLLPLDTRNLYRCGWYPRQLVTQVNKVHRTPYDHNFGGAVAIRPEQYQHMNGFPNTLVGDLDAGYDDLLQRIEALNYTVEMAPENVGRYRSLKNINRNKTETLLGKTPPYSSLYPINLDDGLSTLSYKAVRIELHKLYCLISVISDDEDSVQPSSSQTKGSVIKEFRLI